MSKDDDRKQVANQANPQDVRDGHYREDGVDELGNAPENVEFDAEGNATVPEAKED